MTKIKNLRVVTNDSGYVYYDVGNERHAMRHTLKRGIIQVKLHDNKELELDNYLLGVYLHMSDIDMSIDEYFSTIHKYLNRIRLIKRLNPVLFIRQWKSVRVGLHMYFVFWKSIARGYWLRLKGRKL